MDSKNVINQRYAMGIDNSSSAKLIHITKDINVGGVLPETIGSRRTGLAAKIANDEKRDWANEKVERHPQSTFVDIVKTPNSGRKQSQ